TSQRHCELREAIEKAKKQELDCFVARAPRNDERDRIHGAVLSAFPRRTASPQRTPKPMIVVSPLEHLDASVARHRPSHVLTLLSPRHQECAPREPPFEQHLQLYFHDITETRSG